MKRGVIVASFGTTHDDTRKKTIDVIENDIKDTYKDSIILSAWTSDKIRAKLKKRYNLHINDIKEALEEAIKLEIEDLLIISTHIMDGIENNKVKEAIACYKDKFSRIRMGNALLESDEDFDDSIDSILSSIYSDEDDTNSDSGDSYGDDSDSYGSNSSNDDIFSRMMNNYGGSSNRNDISDSVPSDVPIITREFLVNLFKGRLLSKTPTFSKVEDIEAGEDRFKDAETLIISAYAAAAGKEVDEIANKVYLDSMKENL